MSTEALDDRRAIDSDSDDEQTEGPGDLSTRLAFWTFVAATVAAVPVLLWIGSYRWFFADEWSFLADRSVTIDGLFRPHNGQHWVTIPVLVYRGLYSLFGLHAYWPYQLVVITLHLSAAALLRVVMRRAAVNPWIATTAAFSFILLGPAEDNILWAFQITFVGALVAGLVQILLADHDGPIDVRDWLGLLAGLAAIMMSGQGPAFVAGAGIVCLLRKRWAAAAFHTVPLAAVFLLWARLESAQLIADTSTSGRMTASDYLTWMRGTLQGLSTGFGGHWWLTATFVVVLLAGSALAIRTAGWHLYLRRACVPVALVAVCWLTVSAAAPSRFVFGAEAAQASRYIGIVVALTLPIVAVAADAIVGWRRQTLVPVCLLFLLTVPLNATRFRSDSLLSDEFFSRQRIYVSRLAEEPLAAEVPAWVEPDDSIVGQPDVTLGWLRRASAERKLPETSPLDWYQRAMLPIQLGVVEREELPHQTDCHTYGEPLRVSPEVGERWTLPGQVKVSDAVNPGLARVYGPAVVEVTLPGLELLVSPAGDAAEFELCR